MKEAEFVCAVFRKKSIQAEIVCNSLARVWLKH